MYERDAEPEEGSILAGLHKIIGDQQQREVECWPENWMPLHLFMAMGTQWNAGFSGAIGLRYEAMPWVFEKAGVEPEKETELFESLRIMEAAALGAMR